MLFLCEALERRTKRPGRRNGIISAIGLTVLRALLFQFMNRQTGALFPSYNTLERATGLCRQSIANALARLERCGVLKITRRLVRQYVNRQSPITGEPETILTIDIVVIGGSRDKSMDSRYDAPDVRTLSYNDVISQARHDLEWLIKTLGR